MEVERTFEYWMGVVARRRAEGGPEALKAPGDDSDLVAVGLTVCELLRQIRDELRRTNGKIVIPSIVEQGLNDPSHREHLAQPGDDKDTPE